MTPLKPIHAATLQDFQNFHGMLCHPRTAARCIHEFTGSILFLPNDYSSDGSLAVYDCTGATLNLLSYYLLVLATFTGLCTLLGQTLFLVGREELEAKKHPTEQSWRAERTKRQTQDDELMVDSTVIGYIQKQFPDSTKLILKRRFEYEFSIFASVVMLHLQCNQNRTHLVEVYHIRNPVLRILYRKLFRMVHMIRGGSRTIIKAD